MRCSQGGLRLGRDKQRDNAARPFLLLCEYNHKSLMVVKDFLFISSWVVCRCAGVTCCKNLETRE
jgi:hypothetical protein